MLAAVTGAVAKKVIELGCTAGPKKIEQWKFFQDDVEDIRADLEMIVAAEEDLIMGKVDPSKVKIQSMEEMRGLAQKIEDTLDGILRYAKSTPLHQLMQVSRHMGSHPFAKRVKKLKKQLKDAKQRALDFNVNSIQPSTMARLPVHDYSSRCPGIRKLVGISKPKEEILELLGDIKCQTEQLTVICIVGFGGSGKSTLADAVCQDVKKDRPFCWIDARQHKDNIEGLRKSIPDQTVLRQETERYLIVLDNIEDDQWNSISSTFSKNSTAIIIVTTTAQSVANLCSRHGNGHVYNMRILEDSHSEEFLKSVLESSNSNLSRFEDSLKFIVKKCDGHPMALDGMATYLLRNSEFTKEDFCNFWGHLGNKMKEFQEFKDLEQILMYNYLMLPGYKPHNVRACLLYICAFPDGHLIRRTRLLRRWLAEGYSLEEANESFKKLVDQNIFRTIGSSMEVRTCRVHGIIHGFMMHMSKTTRFMESANNSQRRNYRHLYQYDGELEVCQSQNSEDNNSEESFHAHSLTICRSSGKNVIKDLPKCKVLRALDLEECDDLESDDIKDIDKLWHLKYLSLGRNIDKLPEKVDMLYCLEMLDLRKTKIDTIPVEVIKLPHLAHLLGKFKLEDTTSKNTIVEKLFLNDDKSEKSLEKKCNLQTLAGFITDDNDCGFARLMVHMKKLNKVKIWCESTDKHSVGFTALSKAIKTKFLQARLDTAEDGQSLSLYLADSSSEILRSLGNTGETVNGHLSTLKLHGALSGHIEFASMLSGLKELCLSSTNGLTTTDLKYLHKLKYLKYLILVKVHLAGFEITRGHFSKLLRLCLVQCHGTVPTIGEEALPSLESLWILDKDLDGPSEIKIEKHKHLQEVALDSSVEQATITSWDEAAKKHPKRPKVLFFKCVGSNGTGSIVKYVATERPDRRLESNSVEQLSSNLEGVNFGDANSEEAVAVDRPPASTELCDVMDIGMASSSTVVS